jgi:hypothetical protein
MARKDDFATKIVEMVLSRLPDEAILEVVGKRLGAPLVRTAGFPTLPARHNGLAARKVAAGKASRAGARKPRSASPARQELLSSVERIVRSGSGVSASDVARAAHVPQTRAASALKELKLAKRIFQGGDRRFARYAGDAKVAEQASQLARSTASGPVVGKKARARRLPKKK